MRLGQLARKYDIPVQDIITYLEANIPNRPTFHPNSKVEEHEEAQILDHFNIPIAVKVEPEAQEIPEPVEKEPAAVEPSPKEEVLIKPSSVETPLDDIASVEGEIESSTREALPPEEKEVTVEELEESTPLESIKVENPAPKEEEVIDTDRLLELLESEDESVDLSKFKLIKAAKKELSGLKMVGKIDLPEPKKKVEENEEQEAEEIPKFNKNERNQRPQLSEEERENRRLRARQKQEEFEAREKKRRKQQEDQELKTLREAHYKKKLERQKAAVPKRKTQKQAQVQVTQQTVEEQRPKPKTLMGRFWRWMNSID
jgi:hypothetical protein